MLKLNVGARVVSCSLHPVLAPFALRSLQRLFSLPQKWRRYLYAGEINPQTPMWMGFSDQQVAGSGPAAITTFQGNSSARFTTARSGDYFDNGSLQHLAHVIEDLAQFYKNPDESFTERVQYMFRSDPIPSLGNSDQFTNGGGAAFLTNDATIFTSQPKLQFTVFMPSADFFKTMRANQAALNFQKFEQGKGGSPTGTVDADDNGLERFLTATRRHRAFPLVEFTNFAAQTRVGSALRRRTRTRGSLKGIVHL